MGTTGKLGKKTKVTLKMGSMTRPTEEVVGWVHGYLSVHRSPRTDVWAIAHTPTGCRVFDFATRAEAAAVRDALHYSGIDWEGVNENNARRVVGDEAWRIRNEVLGRLKAK